jgi:catechol 2,3-dioxygenase-like lactoylglutathione lyase family enzyme
MLRDKEAIATIAVKNIAGARKFYEGTLGLQPEPTPEQGVQNYRAGSAKLLVYESQFAGTNQATAVTWIVDDVEREVAALKERGVTFEHYDLPGLTRRGDVHLAGTLKNAWLKDPDGNIISIVST